MFAMPKNKAKMLQFRRIRNKKLLPAGTKNILTQKKNYSILVSVIIKLYKQQSGNEAQRVCEISTGHCH